MTQARALLAEFYMALVQLRRYPTESISQLVGLTVLFYGLFLGASYMSGNPLLGHRLSDIIVSYGLWTLCLGAVANIGHEIGNEAQNGTLEQVFLIPLGGGRIFLYRGIAQLVSQVILTSVVILIISLITRHHLSFSALDLVPMAMASLSAMGVGYLVASVTLLFKRSGQLLSIVQFILLFFIMIPFSSFHGWLIDVTIFVPLGPMIASLKQMMVDGHGLLTVHGWFWWGFVNVALWLGIGYLVFLKTSRKAARLGVLGHY